MRALTVSLLVVFGWSVASTLVVDPALAGTRGITVQVMPDPGSADQTQSEVVLYTASYALVIGNDAYPGGTNGWPPLRNAINDAQAVAEELRRNGFEVELQTNLDSAQLKDTFKRFLVVRGADPEARLLIWYAGHGTTVGGEGFLVPVDAPLDSDKMFLLSAYPLSEIDVHVRLAEAKHVLAIFDSCFAGTIFESRAGVPPPAITQATTQPVRQFMTSGDADQPVSDNGDFRDLFIRAIRGEESGDANGDGYLTGSELGYFLADRMTNLSHGAQTPRYGKLLHRDFNRGDFVFVLPAAAKASEAASTETATAATGNADASATGEAAFELAYWDSVKSSTSAEDYRAYLEVYSPCFPEGNRWRPPTQAASGRARVPPARRLHPGATAVCPRIFLARRKTQAMPTVRKPHRPRTG